MNDKQHKFWNDRAVKLRECVWKNKKFALQYNERTAFYEKWNETFQKEWEKENGKLEWSCE